MCKAGEGEATQAISSLECSRRLLSGKTSCDKNGAAERKVWVETQGRALPGFGAGGHARMGTRDGKMGMNAKELPNQASVWSRRGLNALGGCRMKVKTGKLYVLWCRGRFAVRLTTPPQQVKDSTPPICLLPFIASPSGNSSLVNPSQLDKLEEGLYLSQTPALLREITS